MLGACDQEEWEKEMQEIVAMSYTGTSHTEDSNGSYAGPDAFRVDVCWV